jgi:23S rRNA (cytidine1920-2'-O)/16S rRNA (cytidine1409-2'-O)-methyltransferase
MSPTARGRGRRRLDLLLVDRGLAESRARAQALIMAGLVFSGDRRLDKAGMLIDQNTVLAVKGRDHPWVSRGGVKLAHALDRFGIDPAGLVCLDLGASTGGFTDVLLTRGAARVYAVDVGRGQLAWRLRVDPRVILLERVNARDLTSALVPEQIDLVVCDVSFISLRLALPPALALAAPGARLLALIKPQFEVGRDQVGKGGIVRDPGARLAVCEHIAAWVAAQPGWRVSGVVDSPVAGAEGNLEYLLAAVRSTRLEPATPALRP